MIIVKFHAFGKPAFEVFEADQTAGQIVAKLSNICETFELEKVGIIEDFENLPVLMESLIIAKKFNS